jgi:hypothetical protein
MIDPKRGTNLMALVLNCRARWSGGPGRVVCNRQWAAGFEVVVTSREKTSTRNRFVAFGPILRRFPGFVPWLAPREFLVATQRHSTIGTTHENKEQNNL